MYKLTSTKISQKDITATYKQHSTVPLLEVYPVFGNLSYEVVGSCKTPTTKHRLQELQLGQLKNVKHTINPGITTRCCRGNEQHGHPEHSTLEALEYARS